MTSKNKHRGGHTLKILAMAASFMIFQPGNIFAAYVNGNGIAEATGPITSTNNFIPAATGGTVTVTVPIDTDTGYVCAILNRSSSSLVSAGTTVARVGYMQNISVQLVIPSGLLVPGDNYYILVATATSYANLYSLTTTSVYEDVNQGQYMKAIGWLSINYVATGWNIQFVASPNGVAETLGTITASGLNMSAATGGTILVKIPVDGETGFVYAILNEGTASLYAGSATVTPGNNKYVTVNIVVPPGGLVSGHTYWVKVTTGLDYNSRYSLTTTGVYIDLNTGTYNEAYGWYMTPPYTSTIWPLIMFSPTP